MPVFDWDRLKGRWNASLPKGKFPGEFCDFRLNERSAASFAKGQPEIILKFKILSSKFSHLTGECRIFPFQDEAGQESGATKLSKALEAMDVGIEAENLSEQAVLDALDEALRKKAAVWLYSTGDGRNRVYVNGWRDASRGVDNESDTAKDSGNTRTAPAEEEDWPLAGTERKTPNLKTAGANAPADDLADDGIPF